MYSADLVAQDDLVESARSIPCPFLLHASHTLPGNDCRLLLTRSIIPTNTGKLRSQTTAFELLEVSIDPTKRTSLAEDDVGHLEMRWKLRGGDMPFWCAWWNDGWLVLSGDKYSVYRDDDGVQESEEQSLGLKRVSLSPQLLNQRIWMSTDPQKPRPFHTGGRRHLTRSQSPCPFLRVRNVPTWP